MKNLRFESHRHNGGAAEAEFNFGEVRRAAASFQENPQEDGKMSETEIITIRKPDGTTETKTVEKKKLQFHMANKVKIIPTNRQGQLNTGYLATLAGVLKIAEIVLSFIAFILAICADRRTTTAAWTEHISFETLLIVSALLLGYVVFPHLTIKDEATREGLIVVELIFYGVNTLLYFISIWLMVHLSASWGTDGRGAAIMTAVICVALTVLFAIETVVKLKAWRGENEPTTVIEAGNAQA
ncbi:MARVEL domain-containing protein [Caenorhabditis elegans]|uniref:MARVEL domain-containing protein n=1 Tax=Caenorhabditis elegans TaxID=6239 RepID=D9N146_CAEEL|nr:MARVEL domain-containing protein [Caenorhabditis elegans]CBO25097.1 MARVEL domain-containing protein [Caenorhabditis elegans]|eukprot:NP_001256124.1 Uncharacterized protein CELE_K09G1.1 [Caenorhabditis elegans]